MPDTGLVIHAVDVEAIGQATDLNEPETALQTGDEAYDDALQDRFFANGAWYDARYVRREELAPGRVLTGPAVLLEEHTSIVIEPGWQAEVTAHNHVALKRIEARTDTHAVGTQADPVMLEVFNNLYMSIAEQMGAVLENTAASVTIKERLDFSCAVFDEVGDLIANAPHMPVSRPLVGTTRMWVV